MRPLALSILPETFSVARLEPGATVPAWAQAGDIQSVTRTSNEISIVCREDAVPRDVQSRGGWRALRVAGPLDFALTGILASLARPLAEAGISIFAFSTFDTDYVLVPEASLSGAVRALHAAGHHVAEEEP